MDEDIDNNRYRLQGIEIPPTNRHLLPAAFSVCVIVSPGAGLLHAENVRRSEAHSAYAVQLWEILNDGKTGYGNWHRWKQADTGTRPRNGQA